MILPGSILPVHGCSLTFYPGENNDKTLDSIIRVQHIIDENIKFKKLTSPKSLPKMMRSQFTKLRNLNTIVIENECHDNIIQTIDERNHMDYEEDLEFEETNVDSELDSDDEDEL